MSATCPIIILKQGIPVPHLIINVEIDLYTIDEMLPRFEPITLYFWGIHSLGDMEIDEEGSTCGELKIIYYINKYPTCGGNVIGSAYPLVQIT